MFIVFLILDFISFVFEFWIRCVFEMHMAKKLKKGVELCPFIDWTDCMFGDLERDVCIADIDEAVDSKLAICGNKDDMRSIQESILASSKDGFSAIDRSVKEIQLDYLLAYTRWINGIIDKQKQVVETLVASVKVMID